MVERGIPNQRILKIRMSRVPPGSKIRQCLLDLRMNRSVGGKLESEALRYVIGRIALSNFCIALCEPLDRFLQATGSPGLVGALSGMLKLDVSDKSSIVTFFGPQIETDVNEFLTCVDFVTYRLCRSCNLR